MDNMHIDNSMEQIKDESTEQILSSCPSRLDVIFGEPEELPRVGDQYQAKIPPILSKYEFSMLMREPTNSEALVNALGLPIPVMWSKSEIENIDGIAEIASNNECESDEKFFKVVQPKVSEAKLSPFPGSLGGPWTVIEHESFLLCLYIFGKNLDHLKKFVESKDMGDILSYYYGNFYLSAEYRRWSECRKSRGKRSVHGKKILTGWRQQELLSRLKCHISEETKNTLLELTKKFKERKLLFEEYATMLKNTVGIKALVDAVGIGKGKQDLTNVVMEPSRTSVQPEIPIGKACASLKTADIVKFLTGGFRLSKSRSSDLFWEAVWPRLLAQGWHSEKPEPYGSVNALVFLLPGVKKFSSKLRYGKHYFRSISDILKKVASEPQLLNVEMETREEGMKFTVVDTSLSENVRELRSLPVETSCDIFPSNETKQFKDYDDEAQKLITPNPADDLNNGDLSDLAIKSNLGRPFVPQVSPDFSSFAEILRKNFCQQRPEPLITSENESINRAQRPEPLRTSDNESITRGQRPEPLQVPDSKIELPVIKNLRQSTRNRPMTTKALEALAFGINSPKKRKGEGTSPGKSMPTSSKRVYGNTNASSTPKYVGNMDTANS